MGSQGSLPEYGDDANPPGTGTTVPTTTVPASTVVPWYLRYTVLAGTSLPACTYGTVDIGQAGISWYVFIQLITSCKVVLRRLGRRPLRAKHRDGQCSAQSHVRLPRDGALESP